MPNLPEAVAVSASTRVFFDCNLLMRKHQVLGYVQSLKALDVMTSAICPHRESDGQDVLDARKKMSSLRIETISSKLFKFLTSNVAVDHKEDCISYIHLDISKIVKKFHRLTIRIVLR